MVFRLLDSRSDPSSTTEQSAVYGHAAVEKDPVWDLLSKDATTYPVKESAWFAARTAAMAQQTPQGSSFISGISTHLRWWISVPVAGVAAIALLLHTGNPLATTSKLSQSSPAIVTANSAETMFEQHMEMLASSYSSDSNYQ